MNPKARSMRLDVLRAVAVFLVMCTHGNYPPGLCKLGWVGVDLFFVLSGFLISGLLFSEFKATGSIDWKRFLIRRGFKIYPAFYIFLAITILTEWLLRNRIIRTRELFAEVLFFQNYFKNYRFWGHTWSLAIEEHFYLLLPACLLLLALLQRKNREPLRQVPFLILLLAIIILAGRTYTAYRGFWVYSHTHTRADALASGVALSWFWHFRHHVLKSAVKRFRWLIVVAVPLLISPALFFDYDAFIVSSVGLTTIYLGMVGALAFVLFLPSPGKLLRLAATPAARVGVYSYSIYLWHAPVRDYLHILDRPSSAGAFGGYVIVSLFIGIGMSRLVEIPSLRLREKLFSHKERARESRPESRR